MNIISLLFNFFTVWDLDISFFDFIGDPKNPHSGNPGQGGDGNSSGGGPGHEPHVYRPDESNTKDNDNSSSSYNKSRRERLLEKPSDDVEINTVEGAINHLEKLVERERNIRMLIAKDMNISRDIRLRDLDISFKKPLTTPIAKYLDNCRRMEDPRRRLFHKASPGNTRVNHILDYLRNKL